MDKDILIIAQVITKLFADVEKRLPEDDLDTERISVAILKTYKAAMIAQSKINQTKK